MVRIRKATQVVALGALALGLAATGCKKNDDKAASGDKASGGGGGASGDLALLPVDAQAVIGINFGQLQQSALWKQFVAPKLGDAAPLAKFKTLCGFDPLESLKSVTIGVKNMDDKVPNAVFVLHGYDKAKSMTCFDKDGIEEAQKDGSKVTMDGDVALITGKDGTQLGFTFVDDSTAIGVIGPDAASKDSIKKIAAGGGTLSSSKAFTDMFSKVKSGDTVWAVINGDAAPLKQAAALGIKPKAAFGSVNITDGLSFDGHIRMATPDDATQFVTLAKTQAGNPQVKNFVDKFDVTADGADANISVVLSAQKLQAIASMFGGMRGGM